MATSIIKGGIKSFVLERDSGISGGQGYGIYDSRSGIVRINFNYNNGDTTINTSTPLFTVPSEYRPNNNKSGSGVVWTGGASSPLMAGAVYSVNTEGIVKQSTSGYATRGFGYIEYTI